MCGRGKRERRRESNIRCNVNGKIFDAFSFFIPVNQFCFCFVFNL